MALVLTAALSFSPTPSVTGCPPIVARWCPPPPPLPFPFSVGVERWRAVVERYFPPWAVNAALRVIGCETGHTYDPDAWNSRSGASGLFQHMPRYWSERSSKAGWGGYSIFHPEANVAVAAWLWGQTGTWAHWSCKP